MSVALYAAAAVAVAAAALWLARFVHLDEYVAVVLVGGLFRRNGARKLRPWNPDTPAPAADDPVLAYYTWDMFRPIVYVRDRHTTRGRHAVGLG